MKKVNLTLMTFLMEAAVLFTGWEKTAKSNVKPRKTMKSRQQNDESLGFEDLCFRLDNMLKPFPQK